MLRLTKKRGQAIIKAEKGIIFRNLGLGGKREPCFSYKKNTVYIPNFVMPQRGGGMEIMMQEKREPRAKVEKRQYGIKELFYEIFGDRAAANKRLIGIIVGVAFGFCAYFMGKCNLLFSTFPLGIALLCAAERHLPFILIGLCLSAPSTGLATAVCVSTYCVTVVIRIFSRLAIDSARGKSEKRTDSNSFAELIAKKYRALFEESIYLRMATSAIAAFCLSLYAVIAGGFRYYDLFGACFSIVTAPVATFMFSAGFDKKLKGTWFFNIGVLSILVALTYSIRDLTVFGVYIGAFVAFFATLLIGRRKGILVGCISGLCIGLAFRPIYAPLFILEAAAAGVLWNISSLAAATAGAVVGMIWGVYVNGFSALSELLPALLCGAMVFGAADRLALMTENPELIRIKQDDKTALETVVKTEINRSDEACMKRLSFMFSSLAESFYNLSDRLRRPAALDLRQMCDGVFDKYCGNCPRREVCWGVEYSTTLEILNKLAADLHMKARADIASVPEYLKARCDALPALIDDINESCARLTEHALLCDRTGVFAVDYDGISKILEEALARGRSDYIIDESSAEKVEALLKKLRYGHSGVIVYGGRRKTVVIKGLDASRSKIGIGDLRGAIEGTLGILMGDPIFVPVGSRFDVTVSTRRKYALKQYYSSVAATEIKGKGICGDNVCGFETHRDCYYSLLSDGMGTGKEAALSSRIAGMFLEKMLTAGNRPETSVRLLNSFMSERDGSVRHECSVTADLLEFDLITGQFSIFKSGASPTYIKRGDNCFKLRSNTLPLGILDKPDIERIRFDAQPGDRIVMVSDGVTQNREELAWLQNMLTNDFDSDGEKMAKKITDRAKAEGSEDDITAVIIEIEEAR